MYEGKKYIHRKDDSSQDTLFDIPSCLGYKSWTDCGYEYDCDCHEDFDAVCEHCICVTASYGEKGIDPRTGKEFNGEAKSR